MCFILEFRQSTEIQTEVALSSPVLIPVLFTKGFIVQGIAHFLRDW